MLLTAVNASCVFNWNLEIYFEFPKYYEIDRIHIEVMHLSHSSLNFNILEHKELSFIQLRE